MADQNKSPLSPIGEGGAGSAMAQFRKCLRVSLERQASLVRIPAVAEERYLVSLSWSPTELIISLAKQNELRRWERMHFAAAGCHSAFELQSGEANNEGISSVFVDKGHLTNATITIAQIKVIPSRVEGK